MKQLFLLLLLSLTLGAGDALAQPATIRGAASVRPSTPGNPPPPIVTSLLMPLPGTDQIQLKLVNCNTWFLWGLDCGLSRLILPASAHLDQWDLQFENPAAKSVKVLNTAVTANGVLNTYQLTAQKAIAISPGTQPLAPQPIVSLPMSLNRSAMPPNQYNGAVYLRIEGQDSWLRLPLDLRVRTGPSLPLLVVLAGIILGRLFQYMQKQGSAISAALSELYRLNKDTEEAHPDDRRLLAGMAVKARKLIDRQQIEAATTQINMVRNRLEVLTQLRNIEERLPERSELMPEVIQQVRNQIAAARDAIALEQDARAKEYLEKMTPLLMESISIHGPGGRGNVAMESVLSKATSNLRQNTRSLTLPVEPPSFRESLQQLLTELMGLADQARTDATFWFIRPLLYLTLLVTLTTVGVNTLYIDKGETFGAKPLSDYLGLILWGLSADVVSRSLSSLQGQRE
jgi:hypothetical protein